MLIKRAKVLTKLFVIVFQQKSSREKKCVWLYEVIYSSLLFGPKARN